MRASCNAACAASGMYQTELPSHTCQLIVTESTLAAEPFQIQDISNSRHGSPPTGMHVFLHCRKFGSAKIAVHKTLCLLVRLRASSSIATLSYQASHCVDDHVKRCLLLVIVCQASQLALPGNCCIGCLRVMTTEGMAVVLFSGQRHHRCCMRGRLRSCYSPLCNVLGSSPGMLQRQLLPICACNQRKQVGNLNAMENHHTTTHTLAVDTNDFCALPVRIVLAAKPVEQLP